VVIPHDGISCMNQPSGVFSNFHMFDDVYVQICCPRIGGESLPYYPGNQCYWQDTEFVLRAHHYGRLIYEPRCVVNHLHWSRCPSMLSQGKRRQSGADANEDAVVFAEHMRNEGINIWKVADRIGFNMGSWKGRAGAALEALKIL